MLKAMQVDEQNQIEMIKGELTGQILKGRYLIGRHIDNGSFGQVHKIIDLQDKTRPLVIKISADYKLFGKEINAMKKAYKKTSDFVGKDQSCSIPEVVEYGMIIQSSQNLQSNEEPVLMSYMIMPRFGSNLENYFEKQSCKMTNKSILHFGICMLKLIEGIHSAGFTYNDLKLDNVLVGFQNKIQSNKPNCFEDCSLHLVDFGFATRFIDKKTRKHIDEQEIGTFRGNMIFASMNQLDFQMTSRRDDLISLCYLLIYLLNNGNLKGIDLSQNLSRNESFNLVKKAKSKYSVKDFCCDNASKITSFVEAIFKLSFKETPDYKLLTEMLKSGLTPLAEKRLLKMRIVEDSGSDSSVEAVENFETSTDNGTSYKLSGATSNDLDMEDYACSANTVNVPNPMVRTNSYKKLQHIFNNHKNINQLSDVKVPTKHQTHTDQSDSVIKKLQGLFTK